MNLLVQSGVTELFRYTCFCGDSYVQDTEMSALHTGQDALQYRFWVCEIYSIHNYTNTICLKKSTKKQLSWYEYKEVKLEI